MKKNQIFTDNSELCDADKAVKDFVKSHSKKLTDEEHNELGSLLEKRASTISDILGAKVSSIVSTQKEK